MILNPRLIIPALLTALLFISGPAAAKKVGGVELPDSLSAAGSELTLNGAGIRKKLFIKVYVGGLYLAEASNNADAIMDADEAMAISLHVKSDLLTKKKLLAALDDGLKKSTGGDTSAIDAEIDQLKALFTKDVRPGDVLLLAYEPGVGTHVSMNDEKLDVIAGLPFKKALFGIWISKSPAQESLKKAMLGG